jgi:hypothetical protein
MSTPGLKARAGLLLGAGLLWGTLAWCGWYWHRQNLALAAVAPAPELAPPRAVLSTPAPAEAASADEVRAETEREKALRLKAEAEIAKLEPLIPAHEGEILVSYGGLQEMARKTALAVRKMMPLIEGQPAPKAPTTRDEDKIMSEFVPMLTDLKSVEDDPHEIAQFHAEMLRSALGLDDATTKNVAAFLEPEFDRLKSAGLTASFEPATDPEAWQQARDAAVTEIAGRLRTQLPDHPWLDLLPGMLDISGGFRSQIVVGKDGRTQMFFKLPLFPKNSLL